MKQTAELSKLSKKKITTRAIAFTGIIAAAYAVTTLAIAPLSFGAIQLRFSEVLVLLAFIDAGFQCAAFCEIDKNAVKLYNAYYDTEKEIYFKGGMDAYYYFCKFIFQTH